VTIFEWFDIRFPGILNFWNTVRFEEAASQELRLDWPHLPTGFSQLLA